CSQTRSQKVRTAAGASRADFLGAGLAAALAAGLAAALGASAAALAWANAAGAIRATPTVRANEAMNECFKRVSPRGLGMPR
ncbi:MAG: hypothetical protein EOP93_22110, partial [Lysobacteraceae bacterium]